jgi:hypothetical protein
MQKEILIDVRTEHFRRAVGYIDPTKCPLALAVSDVMNISDDNQYFIGCCQGEVTIKNLKAKLKFQYNVTLEWCQEQTLYLGEYEGLTISNMIDMAKADRTLEFPPLTLKLTLKGVSHCF